MSTQSIEILLNQSVQLHQIGHTLKARSGFRKILKKIPAHVNALYFIGLTYLQTREYEKAIASLERALAIKPDYVEACFNLGNALYEMERFEDAVASYKQALSINPEYWKAQINLGNILQLQKRPEEAISRYRQTLAIKPDSAEAYIGLGAAHGELKEFEEAINSYQKAILLNPHLADAHNNLGYAFSALTKFHDAANSFKEAINLNPGYIDAHIGLARSLVELNQHQEAVSSYKKAYSIRPDAECAYELAVLLSRLAHFKEAIFYYQHVLSLEPEFIEALYSLGVALDEASRFDEAISTYEKALALDPQYCDVLNNLGNTFLQVKKYEEAMSCYQRALSIDPNYFIAYMGIGNTLKELGQFEKAISCYERTLSTNPDFSEAYVGLGNAWAELGQPRKAISCYDRALLIKPESTLTQWNRALTHLLLGHFKKGWADYEKRWGLKRTVPLPETPYPRWLGQEKIHGKKLVIQIEQGFGDAIQMVRYISVLEKQDVECWIHYPEQLGKLISRSFPNAHICDDNIIPGYLDYHIPAMSLPSAMGTFSEASIPNSVPYLIADPERVTYWQDQLASASPLKVGLVWRGDPGHQNDRNRSTQLSVYMPLIKGNPGIRFITMQKSLTQEERALLQENTNVHVLDTELTDFDEAAAVMSNLDVMITIDSAPAHLAGALAIPTWILLPFNGEWRWLMNRTDSPWYPTANLFRQKTIGNWNGVINTVDNELKKLELEGIAMSSSINQYQTGFTLLELLVVMVIIGLLAGYVGPKYFAQIGKSEVKTARAQLDALGKALDQYRLDTGHYPNTEQGLAALNTAPSDESKWQGPYLQKTVPPDPWGKAYQYKLPGEHGEYDLWSFGKDGQPGGTEESADIVNW